MNKFLRHIILVPCLLVSAFVLAELPQHTNILTLEYGGLWQNDEYLSPNLYRGQIAGLQHEWWTDFRCDDDWSHVAKLHILGGFMDNNRLLKIREYAFGGNVGWGAHYNFRRLIDVKGLNVFVGPYLQGDYLGRTITSNQNKPYSMDLSLMLQAQAGVSYSIRCAKTAYRLQYVVATDLLGAMFVPEYWQSYYEMSQTLRGTIVCGSVHNRQMLQHALTLDMEFKRSTWRIGVRHEYLQTHEHNLHFSREQVCVVIGTIFTHRVRKTLLK